MSETRTGHRAVVTGGARGLGAAVAARLVQAGWSVVLLDQDRAAGRAQAERLQALGPTWFVPFDAADSAAAGPAVAAAVERLGGLDLLVCAAHQSCERPVEQISPADWDRVIGTDLNGAFFPVQAAVAHLAAGVDPCVVHLSAVQARVASGLHAVYAAAMAAVAAVSRSLAAELAPLGVRCCCVSPYTVLTESTRDRLAEPGWRELQESTVLSGGIMTAPELADLVHQIVTEPSLFNACDIVLDGGMNIFRERPTVSPYQSNAPGEVGRR
ncbi:MAG: SDR family oxidoreductase [Propionibacteriaceae bacterium]|jgi:NAD(P)-dependent dehydrogenase (short-subunit alcohol dehydrogenase family)|nr:SDR family oxidoreductase [Propionibacteriaceae bacterium]